MSFQICIQERLAVKNDNQDLDPFIEEVANYFSRLLTDDVIELASVHIVVDDEELIYYSPENCMTIDALKNLIRCCEERLPSSKIIDVYVSYCAMIEDPSRYGYAFFSKLLEDRMHDKVMYLSLEYDDYEPEAKLFCVIKTDETNINGEIKSEGLNEKEFLLADKWFCPNFLLGIELRQNQLDANYEANEELLEILNDMNEIFGIEHHISKNNDEVTIEIMGALCFDKSAIAFFEAGLHLMLSNVQDMEGIMKLKCTFVPDEGDSFALYRFKLQDDVIMTESLFVEYNMNSNTVELYKFHLEGKIDESIEDDIIVEPTDNDISTEPIIAECNANSKLDEFLIKNGELIKYTGNQSEIVIPDAIIKIGERAFYQNALIRSVTMSDSIQFIEQEAFALCENLDSITMSSNLLNIGVGAFFRCINLDNIFIPNGLISIGSNAFRGCRNLRKISIPESIISVGEKAFDETAILDECIDSFVLLDNKILIKYIGNDTNIVIPDGVILIAPYAFHDINTRLVSITGATHNSQFENIVLPESLVTIEREAFCGCNSIKNILIPANINNIGRRVFSDCTSLDDFEVSKNNLTFNTVDGVLCSKDKSVLIAYPPGRKGDYIIPDSIKKLADLSFASCKGLTNIFFNNSLSYIGAASFESTNISELTIPKTVTEIGNRAFQFCGALKVVKLECKEVKMGESVFNGCIELKELYIKEGLEFNRCTLTKCFESIDIFILDENGETVANYFIPKSDNLAASVAFDMRNDAITEGFIYYDYYFDNISKFEDKIRIAMSRAFYPFKLKEEDHCKYNNYIKRNTKKVSKLYIGNNESEKIEKLIDKDFINKKNVEEIISISRELKNNSITNMLQNFRGN